MNGIIRFATFFVTGAVGYGGIEIIWRGYTHPAMLVAGGLCFIVISYIARYCKNKPYIYKISLSALCITEIELIFGIIFNIILKQNIWDYSNIPFNILGQICPLYTFLWGVLSLAVIPLAERFNYLLDKLFKSSYTVIRDSD